MATGLLVSIKTKLVVVELTVGGKVLQINPGSWFVVHSTWNRSFVGAVQLSVVFVAVTTALLIDGGGMTKTVKAFVAPNCGVPLSVTTVVSLKAPLASAGEGVQVIIPLFTLGAGTADGKGVTLYVNVADGFESAALFVIVKSCETFAILLGSVGRVSKPLAPGDNNSSW